MLAYVFWHWPKPEVDPAAYERDEHAFHAALAQAAPVGFVRSTVFAVRDEAPWLAGAPAYADWYLLENSAALDALNEVAVNGPCEQPHYALTRAMAAGAGSLLNLRAGAPDLGAGRSITTLVKPREMPYAELDASVSHVQGISSASVWRRGLVLGPTPEFLVLSSAPLAFPAELQPHVLELRQTA